MSKVKSWRKKNFQLFFLQKFSPCYPLHSPLFPIWSLTGKTLLLAMCTLERWASPCTFWETGIPVSDISPSSTLFLEGGNIHWNFTNCELWAHHLNGVLYIIWIPYSDQANVAVHFSQLCFHWFLFSPDTTHDYIKEVLVAAIALFTVQLSRWGKVWGLNQSHEKNPPLRRAIILPNTTFKFSLFIRSSVGH